MADRRATQQDLLRWSEALAGIARTGLGFTESLYERERFEEVLAVAADIRVAATQLQELEDEESVEPETLIAEWMQSVGKGVPGYVTPKVAGRAVGGDLSAHPLETRGVGFFGRDELPEPLAGFGQWGELAFAAIRGDRFDVIYDEPRERPWRG